MGETMAGALGGVHRRRRFDAAWSGLHARGLEVSRTGGDVQASSMANVFDQVSVLLDLILIYRKPMVEVRKRSARKPNPTGLWYVSSLDWISGRMKEPGTVCVSSSDGRKTMFFLKWTEKDIVFVFVTIWVGLVRRDRKSVV